MRKQIEIGEKPLQGALRACRSSVGLIALFSFFANLLMLVPAFYMLQVYDRVIASGSQETLLMLTLIMLFLMATLGGLEWVRARIMVRVSTRLDLQLNGRVFDACFDLALKSGGKRSSAQPLGDLMSLRQFVTGQGLFAFFDVPWLPLYLVVMFLFHPWFGWMAVISAVVLFAIALLNERLTSEMLRNANEVNLAATAHTERSIRNAEVISAMGMLGALRDRWRARNNLVLLEQTRASDRAGSLAAVSRTFRQVVQSLVIGLGAYLVLEGELSPGLMIGGSILLGRALAPVDQIIGTWKGLVTARGQYQRLSELLAEGAAQVPGMALPAPSGEVLVEDLVLAPPGGGRPTLKGVSFNVKCGESIGIVGPSGAGKSSLARAILGIWPPLRGCVRLDGADVSKWDREHLGRFVGYLPQDIELFDGTIAENIARFGTVDPDEVVRVAREAGIHEMILALPAGYDTVIGAVGGALSGGQRQRVGIARALYGRPKLLVLDEPNSNLDEAGEKALGEALARVRANGATVFLITHRPGVLANVDKLLVLGEGEVLAFAEREKVLSLMRARAGRPVTKGQRQNEEIA